jgi:pyruvate dehydrogenase E1 component alpha subunit
VSGTYRSKAELEAYMKRDPIELLKQHMLDTGETTAEAIAALDDELKVLVQDAWDFADQSPEPPLGALYEDVLVDSHT